MKIEQQEMDGDVLRITFDGSLDIAGADAADRPMATIAGTRDRLLLDFSRLDFLASIGVRLIVKSARAIGERGGKVVIVGPNAAARKVLTATGVDKIVVVADDEAAAVAAFAS